MSRRLFGVLAGVILGGVVWFWPSIGTLDPLGQRALAIIACGVVFWATDVLAAGITAVLVLGLLLAAGIPGSVALAGFASSAFWILVSVLFFGYAMDKTGLARRIAYRILLIFPPTYPGILFAFLTIGFVLTLGIPSMTVRTAIIMPIGWALVQALGLPLPGRGSALLVLSIFEMAVLPGCALLTGALWGPFVTGLFANQNIPISWLEYARVMFVPTVVWCVLVLVGNIVVALSIAAWATQPWHKVPPEAIGMLALTALFAGGVLTVPEIGTGISWPLALFVGGILCVSTVITTYKISGWFAGFIVPAIAPVAGQPLLLVTVLALCVMAMRFIDPVGFISIAAFFLALVGVAPTWGITPVVLTGMIFLPLHVFWFNYQNIWIVMTEGITKKSAYTDGDRIRLATVYALVSIVGLWFAVGYWTVTGIL